MPPSKEGWREIAGAEAVELLSWAMDALSEAISALRSASRSGMRAACKLPTWPWMLCTLAALCRCSLRSAVSEVSTLSTALLRACPSASSFATRS